MKTIKHYIHWIKRDIARAIVKNDRIAKFFSKHFLKLFLSLFYFDWTGKSVNWKKPEDFNQWLIQQSWKNSKSADRDKIAMCADKYSVREYVSSMGYADTLTCLYGVYKEVDDIDFESLPKSFVMKMNNASGRNLICRDKSQIDWERVKEMFRGWLPDRTFGLKSGEWQYSLIQPRIVVEEYLESLNESSIIDYKFNCINGHAYSCFVGYNRNPDNPHGDVCFDDYDIAWNRTDNIKDEWHKDRRFIEKPNNYDRMVEMAEKLSKDFNYCRFDVYEVGGKLYFGEMTFTPQGCVLEFYKDCFLREALTFASETGHYGK